MEGLINIVQFMMDHEDDVNHTNAVRAIINAGVDASCAHLIIHVVNMFGQNDESSRMRITTLERYVHLQTEGINKRARIDGPPLSPITPPKTPSSPIYAPT